MKGKAMSEIEDLKKELQALKDQLNPPPRQPSTWQPVDRTAGMTMDPATMLRMAAVALRGCRRICAPFNSNDPSHHPLLSLNALVAQAGSSHGHSKRHRGSNTLIDLLMRKIASTVPNSLRS
jgi:hypothetical protein